MAVQTLATPDEGSVPGLARPAARSLGLELALVAEVWRLAWPAITHMLLVTLVFLVNRVLVGRYSSTALASLQISATILWTVYSIFTAFSAGTLAVVGRAVGAGDRVAAARAARGALLLAVALGLAVWVPLRLANGRLLALLFPRAGAAVLADADAYLAIVLPALPLSFAEAIAAASLQGAGDTRTPLLVGAVGNLLHVGLSAVLVFGIGDLAPLGVRGAAIGAAVALSAEGVLLVGVLLTRRSPLPLAAVLFARARARPPSPGPSPLGKVLTVSLPAFADKLVSHGGYMLYVAIIALLGTAVMASNQALVSIEAICFLSADGFAIAAGAIVAQKLGARRSGEARRAGLFATGMAVALLSLFGLVFAAVPARLVGAFSSDPAIVAEGTRALYVAAVAQPFMAAATVLAMALRGAGDTRTVLAVTVLCALVVRLSVTWGCAVTLGMGLTGVWIGSTADWIARSVLLAAAYAWGGWWRRSSAA